MTRGWGNKNIFVWILKASVVFTDLLTNLIISAHNKEPKMFYTFKSQTCHSIQFRKVDLQFKCRKEILWNGRC